MTPETGPDRARGTLLARVDAELRSRLEDAVDAACLDAIVCGRRARGLPPPVADSAYDRDEYESGVRSFLARLSRDMGSSASSAVREAMDRAVKAAGGDTVRGLMAAQVVLAKQMPDYWQRFEALRASYAAEAVSDGPREAVRSGGEGRGALSLRRFLNRG
jgi:hypothetical protein